LIGKLFCPPEQLAASSLGVHPASLRLWQCCLRDNKTVRVDSPLQADNLEAEVESVSLLQLIPDRFTAVPVVLYSTVELCNKTVRVDSPLQADDLDAEVESVSAL
jgi:hypothetical protein